MDLSRLDGKPHWKMETYKKALDYLEQCSNKKVLYVDMDNVLVNFQSGIDALSEKLKNNTRGAMIESLIYFPKCNPMKGQ